MSKKAQRPRMPEDQPPEIEKDPRKVREQPEMDPPSRKKPEIEESPLGKETPEMPDPDGPQEQPEIDESEPHPDAAVEAALPTRDPKKKRNGPSIDVGGPRDIERGVGIETGEEVGGGDVERGGTDPGNSRR